MSQPGNLVRLLRNTPVREIVAAVEKDGFTLRRNTRTGGRVYSHPDGRIVVIHYHRGSDTMPRGTLQSVLQSARWTENDLTRRGLI